MDDSTAGLEAAAGVMLGAALVTLVISLAFYVWTSIALAAVFRKLGEPAWKAWVPIVNVVTIFQLGSVSAVWVITLFIPVVNIVGLVFAIIALNGVNRRFGKGGGFTVLAVLLLPIWASILGFGRAEAVWAPPAEVAAADFVVSSPQRTTAGSLYGPKSDEQVATQGAPVAPVVADPAVAFGGGQLPPTTQIQVIPVEDSARAAAEHAETRDLSSVVLPSAGQSVPPWPTPAAGAAAASPDDVPAVAAVPDAAAVPGVAPVAAAPVAADPVYEPTEASGPPIVVELPTFTSEPRAETQDAAPVESGVAESWTPPEFTTIPPFHESVIGGENLAEETVISPRRREREQTWSIETRAGQRVLITSPVVLLGRNPVPSTAFPEAQLVALSDPERTVSKTHAIAELADGAWSITDLDSTNGVYLVVDDEEHELQSGVTVSLTDEFVLGELSARFVLDV